MAHNLEYRETGLRWHGVRIDLNEINRRIHEEYSKIYDELKYPRKMRLVVKNSDMEDTIDRLKKHGI